MKLTALLLVLCCVFLAPVVAQEKAAMKLNTAVPDVTLMQKINDGWQTMNTDNVVMYYDKEPTDVFFDAAPLKYVSWKEYEEGSRAGFAGFESLKMAPLTDAVVHRSGNIAWGTAIVHMEVTPKAGKALSHDARWTVIWEKKGPNWLIVHEHFSAPLPGFD